MQKAMNDSIEELEFDAASNFPHKEEDFEKSIDFDLDVVSVDGEGDYDVHSFLKSLGAAQQSNTYRIARALEGILNVVVNQGSLIKGMSDQIATLTAARSEGTRAALTQEMAKSMIAGRPFEVIDGNYNPGVVLDVGDATLGTYKAKMRDDIMKGVKAGTIDNETAMTLLGAPDNTPMSMILRSAKTEVRSIIESAIKQ